MAAVAPVVSQPITNTNVNTTSIVVNAAPAAPAAAEVAMKPWSTGMCGCFEDCGSCCLTFFCPTCSLGCLANDMGESCCLSTAICCMGGSSLYANTYCPSDIISLALLRTKIRAQEKIQGSIMDDYFCSCCCFCFTLCQVHREFKRIRHQAWA